jgi:NAD-dependent dihydropyrimidine dehydrogenase PreA subunit
MKLRVLLHSTTGNTRLVTRYVVARLRRAGHQAELLDIAGHREPPPDMDGIDALLVAGPTMYFRPTFAMESYVRRLPGVTGRRLPTFLLATCQGDPVTQFAILAEILGPKGYAPLAACAVQAQTNWPMNRVLTERVRFSLPLGEALIRVCARLPYSRDLLGTLGFVWPEASEPDEGERDKVDRFVDRLVEVVESGRIDPVPAPYALYRYVPGITPAGQHITREQLVRSMPLRVDPDRCTRCGKCVRVCAAGVMTQADRDAVPVLGEGCTVCWACYNHCEDGAITGPMTREGRGRYPGPSPRMRALFQAP